MLENAYNQIGEIMAHKFKETAVIINQEKIAPDIYSMWLKTESIAKFAKAGQFINIYSNDKSRLLPRPISICEIDKEDMALRVVYRIAGEGTLEFSKLSKGDHLNILGPLGNGFPIKNKKALLIGGGIGIPPMLELAKALPGEVQIVAGYRKDLFLNEELSKNGKLYVSTEDGSAGIEGNVMDAIKANALDAEIIYACGPMVMLKAIKQFAKEKNIEAWISLEERMACGIGACLGGVCKSKKKDNHTNVNNKRVCADGPVFLAEEVDI